MAAIQLPGKGAPADTLRAAAIIVKESLATAVNDGRLIHNPDGISFDFCLSMATARQLMPMRMPFP